MSRKNAEKGNISSYFDCLLHSWHKLRNILVSPIDKNLFVNKVTTLTSYRKLRKKPVNSVAVHTFITNFLHVYK